jgi:hypothetical protein
LHSGNDSSIAPRQKEPRPAIHDQREQNHTGNRDQECPIANGGSVMKNEELLDEGVPREDKKQNRVNRVTRREALLYTEVRSKPGDTDRRQK